MLKDIFGALASMGSMLALLPQIIYTYKKRSAKDISLLTQLCFALAAIFWVLYGILTDSQPVVITNVVFGIFAFILVYLKIRDS